MENIPIQEPAIKNQLKYKPLVDSELWPLIEKYADARCTQAIKSHDNKLKLKVKPEAKDYMKKELLEIVDKYCEEEKDE